MKHLVLAAASAAFLLFGMMKRNQSELEAEACNNESHAGPEQVAAGGRDAPQLPGYSDEIHRAGHEVHKLAESYPPSSR